jgi:hypothetical protein
VTWQYSSWHDNTVRDMTIQFVSRPSGAVQ